MIMHEKEPSDSSADTTPAAASAAANAPLGPEAYANKLLKKIEGVSEDYASNISRFMRFRDTKPDESVETQVLEARGLSEMYPPNLFAHVTSEGGLEVAFREAEEKFGGLGVFYVLNEVNRLVRLRAQVDQWNRQTKGGGTTDADIVSRRAFYFDLDPVRPVKGISASDEESRYAVDVAIRCYAELAADLGSDACLGFGFSGNGAQVYVALDSLPIDDATTAVIRGLLVAAKHVYSTDKVEFDTSVGDAKRLCPAFGTVKRKGVHSPERPHRRTWFTCDETVQRVSLAQLVALLDLRMSRLTPEQRADVEKAMGKKPAAAQATSTAQGKHNVKAPAQNPAPPPPSSGADQKPGPFGAANAVPIREVAEWLDLMQGGYPVCPGCGTTGDSSVAFIGNRLKCLHNRCAEKGRDGLRGVVDLVVEVKGLKPIEAARLVIRQFELDEPAYVFANTANIATPSEGQREAAWSAPVPFDGTGDLPPFPTSALPFWVRAWVEAEAVATQTPVDLAAMIVLGVLATACAKSFFVAVRDTWWEPLNVFITIALGSANRKSPVARDAQRPLLDFEKELIAKEAPAVARNKARRAVLEVRLKDAVHAAAKDASKEIDVEQITADLQKLPAVELPRLIVGDITSEKLAIVMSLQGGRIGVITTEGGLFETMAGRYSDAANIDLYLQAHAGDDHRVDRVGRSPIYLHKPALTMALAVQPEVVRGLVDKPGFRGRGLIARFLFSMPLSLVGSRIIVPPPMPKAVADAYAAGVDRMLRLPTTCCAGTAEIIPTALTLTPAALQEVTDFMGFIEPTMGPGGAYAHMADWVGKLAGAVIRIAGLLHLAERSPTDLISGVTMFRAKNIGLYLLLHARVAFEHMEADPAVADAKYVLDVLRHDGVTSVTKRDLFERTKGRFGEVAKLDEVLSLLVERGYIRKVAQEKNGPGRRSVIFEVNPLWVSQYSQYSQKAPASPPPAPPSSPATPPPPEAQPEPTPPCTPGGSSSSEAAAAAEPATPPTMAPGPFGGVPTKPQRRGRAATRSARAEQRYYEELQPELLKRALANVAADEDLMTASALGAGIEEEGE